MMKFQVMVVNWRNLKEFTTYDKVPKYHEPLILLGLIVLSLGEFDAILGANLICTLNGTCWDIFFP